MGGAQIRTTMARVIAEACASAAPDPRAVWLAPLARPREVEDQHRFAASPDDRRREAGR